MPASFVRRVLAVPRRLFPKPVLAALATLLAPALSHAQWTPLSACPAPSGDQEAFAELDNIEGPWVGLAAFPIRPMTVTPDGDVWAVNTQDSTLVHYVGATADANGPARMPWFPVSVAYWQHDPEDPEDYELLVVCRGTWTMARVDPATLEITALVTLASEPGDIVVDQALGRAFVSCTGADTVVQIDLATNAVRRYHESLDADFRCKSPLFLSLYQPPGTTPCDGEDDPSGCTSLKVLVAPLVSGNNTSAAGASSTPVASGQVLDFEALQSDASKRLPDEDLFLIDPDSGTIGDVSVVLKRAGTMLFQHGVHPDTEDLWLLNTEAHNRPSEGDSEPEVNGHFATNRILVLPTPFGTPTTTEGMSPDPFIDLDPSSSDLTITTANTVGQPFSLCFHPTNGNVFVVGMGSDNVMVLDSAGALVKEWDLPTGSIPRQIALSSTGTAVLVYCWGDNIIRTYRWANNPPTPLATLSLGHDPAPPAVAAGRKVFFSSKNSLEQNLSCATCHVDAGTDFLAWNLSNKPHDNKGPMLTQTLVGLERLAPFHWRGERELEDFDGAFNGLLGLPGNDGIDDEDFADMKAFLFSLKNQPNPFEHRERVIRDDIAFVPSHVGTTTQEESTDFIDFVAANASAIDGQTAFRDTEIFQERFTCHQCHAQPTGTNNDMFIDEPANLPERTRFKTAPFHDEWRKEQTNVIVEWDIGGTPHRDRRAFLGTGVSHAGLSPTVLHFINAITTTSVRDDITAFIHQWDQGLAPAVPFSYLLDSASDVGAAELALRCYLVEQAKARNCDIAVFGDTNSGVPSRWYFDRHAGTSGLFRSDNTALSDRTINDFLSNASTEHNVFIGLPVGMAERFAVDYDMDGDYNQVDSSPLVPLGPDAGDTTAPAFTLAPGPEPMWMTTRACRIRFDTDEPCEVFVRCVDPVSTIDDLEFSNDMLSKTHSVLISGLRPSSEAYATTTTWTEEAVKYTVEITVTDRSGNSSSTPYVLGGSSSTDFQTDEFTIDDDTEATDVSLTNEVILSSLEATVDSYSGGSLTATIEAELDYERGLPGTTDAQYVALIGRVIVVEATDVVGSAEEFTAGTGSLRATEVKTSLITLNVNGPFLLPSDLSASDGSTSVQFTIPGLSSGDAVYYSVEAVVLVEAGGGNTAEQNYDAAHGGGCSSGDCTVLLPGGTRVFDRWDFPATKEFRALKLVYSVP